MLRFFLLFVLLIPSWHAHAQDASRLVVPYGPGPGMDAVARILARQLAVVQGAPVLVENRPGAGTIIGTEHVYRSAADGKTMLINGSALAIAAAENRLTINPLAGLVPVIQVSDADNFLLAHAGLKLGSLDDLLALGKVRGLNCGAVTGQYEIACLQLQALLGGDFVTVVYKGAGEASLALSSGEVDIMFASRSMMAPLLASGKARAIAAATPVAAEPPFDELPLMKTRWPDLVLSGLVGVYVVKDTPPETVARLNRQLNEVLAHPEVKQSFRFLGISPVGGGAAQLSRRFSEDVAFFSSRLRETKNMRP